MELPIKILPKSKGLFRKIYKYDFMFLNEISRNIDHDMYYTLILSLEGFQLKNLYNFLYIKSIRINKKFNTRILKNNKYIKNHSELDTELNNYINNEIMYAFIIINGIQQFLFLLFNNKIHTILNTIFF